MGTHAEGNPQASTEKLARAIVVLAVAKLWLEYRGTPAERPILDELANRVTEYAEPARPSPVPGPETPKETP